MERLTAILSWPLRAVLSLRDRFWHWLCTRRWVSLAYGLPAVWVGLSFAGVLVYESSGWDKQLLRRYQLAANASLDKPDRATAENYLRKLQLLDNSGPETRYVVARLAELQGQHTQALELMRTLAPPDKSGHPRAHYWMAINMLRANRQLSPGDTQRLVQHLEMALGSDQDRQQAHILLADIQRARGDRVGAAEHLEAVVLDRPEMRLPLSVLYTELGDTFRAHQHRHRAIEYFRQRADRDAGNVNAVVMWSKAVALDGDFAQGEEVLRNGLAKQAAQTKEGAVCVAKLQRALADHYVAWYDDQQHSQRGELKSLFALLQKALTNAPDHAAALNRLAALTNQAGPQAAEVQRLLREYIGSDNVPASVRLIMGTSAAAQGNWDEAKQQLEKAHREMPRMPVLLNNLAWVLAFEKPPQLERALAMADAAIKAWPQHPEIHETRGIILVRLERWQDALADLETALSAFPDRPSIHAELATAYEHLGDHDMAERHRKLAGKGK